MSNYLRFDEKHYLKIKSGEKITTIKSSAKKEGPVQLIFKEHLLEAKILSVRFKRFDKLTLENAKSDGYDTLEELKTDLKSYYPKLRECDRVYIHYIELIPEKKQESRMSRAAAYHLMTMGIFGALIQEGK